MTTLEFNGNNEEASKDPSVVGEDSNKSALKHDSAYGSLKSSSNGESQIRESYLEDDASENQTTPCPNLKTFESFLKDEIKLTLPPEDEDTVNHGTKSQVSDPQEDVAKELDQRLCKDYLTVDDAKLKTRLSIVYKHALNYVRKIKENSSKYGVPFSSPYIIHQFSSSRHALTEFFKSFVSLRGFTIAISIQDGTVLQVSPSITDILDFPKDMLLGHSFIDFLYPKDSIHFSSEIINGLSIPFRKHSTNGNNCTSFFCRIRKYHGLSSSGLELKDKRATYKPCRIVFRSQDTTNFAESKNPYASLIIAEIIPLEPAYKHPEESPEMGVFNISHSASCNFSDYAAEAIPYLGYLPQDLTGNSIFDCYHPEDLKKLKKTYEEIVKRHGKPYRSESYRFRTFNNSWVTLITEWICLLNPWTRKIKSIIGQHRILKGPKDIAIFFAPAENEVPPFSVNLILEAQRIQTEIIELLQKPVALDRDYLKRWRPTAPAAEATDNMELPHTAASFHAKTNLEAESNAKCIHKVTRNFEEPSRLPGKHLAKKPCVVHQSNMTPGLESLNSSLEATAQPSSYGQLNYSATLQRFFRSNPKTVSSSDSERKMDSSPEETVGGGKNHPENVKTHFVRSKSISRSSSSEDNKYDSTSFRFCTSLDEAPYCSTELADQDEENSCYMPLTVEILCKHNQDMQRQFMNCQMNCLNKSKHSNRRREIKKLSRRTRKRVSCFRRHRAARESEVKFNMMPNSTNISSMINCDKRMLNSLSPHRTRSISLLSGTQMGVTPFQGPHHNYYIPGTVQETTVASMISTVPKNTTSLVSQSACSFSVPNPVMVTPAATPIMVNSAAASIMVNPTATPIMVNPTATPIMVNSAATPIMVNHASKPTFVPASALPVHPVQYVAPLPGVFYQPIVHQPLLHPPPVCLPNVVYQHSLIQPPRPTVVQPTTTFLSGKRRSENAAAMPFSDRYDVLPKRNLETPNICSASKATSQFADCATTKSYEKHIVDLPSSDQLLSFNSMYDDESSGDVSLLKSTEYNNEDCFRARPMKKFKSRPTLREDPWWDSLRVSPSTILQYQLKTLETVDVLKEDMDKLKKVKQPSTVEDQLASLYQELELEGNSSGLRLDEGITTSSSSSNEDLSSSLQQPSLNNKGQPSKFYIKITVVNQVEDQATSTVTSLKVLS